MKVLSRRRNGLPNSDPIASLRELFDQCKTAADADDAICYHGALALILEFDGDLKSSNEHRRIEIETIERLHKIAQKDISAKPALESYGQNELEYRKEILDELIYQYAG